MNSSFFWKIEKYLLVLLYVLGLFIFIFFQKYEILIIHTFLLFTVFIGFAASFKYNVFFGHLLSFYYLIVGPINLIIAVANPDLLIINRLGTYYGTWIFQKNDILWSYCLRLMIFYSLTMFVMTLINKPKPLFSPLRNAAPPFININSMFALFVIAIIVSIVEYHLRVTYYLDIPGAQPIIPFAGLIVYSTRILKISFLFYILEFVISKHKTKTAIKVLLVGLIIFITHLPDILIGNRGNVFTAIALPIVYYLMLDSKRQKPKIRLFQALVLASFAIVVIGVTNVFRLGYFDTFFFILRRFTGMYDGTAVLEYFENGVKPPYNVFDYFSGFFFKNGETPNYYYTHTILGYPLEASHSNAAPLFINSWYYNGYLGVVIISIFMGFIAGLINRIYKYESKIIAFDEHNILSQYNNRLAIFCSLNAFLILMGLFIDGSSIQISSFIVPLGSYVLCRLVSFNRNINFSRIRRLITNEQN